LRTSIGLILQQGRIDHLSNVFR